MGMFCGVERTNYVRLIEMDDAQREEFEEVLDMMGAVTYDGSGDTEGMVAFFPDLTDDGCFSTMSEDDEGQEIETIPELMKFIKPGEVLVRQGVGFDKQRYVSGWAEALVRRDDGSVETVSMGLNEIYKRAADKLEIPINQITAAEF